MLKKECRRTLEKTVYVINRFLGYTYWLHLGDLLTPCEGNITAGQYFIASRVLDIEKILKGGEPEWHNILSDQILGCDRILKEKIKANQKFKVLIESLDARGLNPNIAKCSVSDNPIVLNNGTHRVGWCILRQPNRYLPCCRDRHDLKPWFPIEGDKYFGAILNAEQLDILRNRFNRILEENVRTE